MKYSELRKKLEKDGWFIKRHGKEHDIYTTQLKVGNYRLAGTRRRKLLKAH